MEPKQSNRLVRYLNKLDSTQLEFVNKIVAKSLRNHVPLADAAIYADFNAGERVKFYDQKNNYHTGIIQKVNQRYVKVMDVKSNKTYHILPMRMTKVGATTISLASKKKSKETPEKELTTIQ